MGSPAEEAEFHVEALTFSVFIQPCLTLAATICCNIVVYEERRQVYGLLLDGQLLPLAADQPPHPKDITCHMTRRPRPPPTRIQADVPTLTSAARQLGLW